MEGKDIQSKDGTETGAEEQGPLRTCLASDE